MKKMQKIKRMRADIFLFCFLLSLSALFIETYQAKAQESKTVAAPPSLNPQPEVFQTEMSLETAVAVPKKTDGLPVQVKSQAPAQVKNMAAEEQQMKMISESLKNVFEENKKLADEKTALENELKQLRGQKEINNGRINALTSQKDDLSKRIGGLEEMQKKYEAQIAELKTTMDQNQQDYQKKLQDIQEQKKKDDEDKAMAMQRILPTLQDKKSISESRKQQDELQRNAQETLSKIETEAHKTTSKLLALKKENNQLAKDSAKVHYNLGNLFFEQGNYKRSAMEYKKVVDLMPYDAAAHYNLAFVSGEFLNDQDTALKHYQEYLRFAPNADDIVQVKEKILEAELALKTHIDSPIDTSRLDK